MIYKNYIQQLPKRASMLQWILGMLVFSTIYLKNESNLEKKSNFYFSPYRIYVAFSVCRLCSVPVDDAIVSVCIVGDCKLVLYFRRLYLL